MKGILRIRNSVDKVVEIITGCLMAGIAIMIFVQVVSRALNIGLQWTEELSRFSYVAITFLGSVVAVSKGRHITITIFLDLMPKWLRKITDIIIYMLMCAFACACTYGTYMITLSSKGIRSNSLAWFQLNYINYVVLIGCALMALSYAINILENLFAKEEVL